MPAFILARYFGSWILYSILAVVLQGLVVWFLDGGITIFTGFLVVLFIVGYIPVSAYLDFREAKEYAGRVVEAIKGKGDRDEILNETIEKASEQFGISADLLGFAIKKIHSKPKGQEVE